MEHTTLSPPLCSKHGCEKTWHRNKAHHSGGQWRCKPCKNGWPAEKTTSSRELHQGEFPPICTTHGCEKAWCKDSSKKRGGDWRCKECKKALRKSNHDPEKERASYRAWAKANPEKKRASKNVWQKANAEKVNAGNRVWAKANPEKCTARTQRRRARKLNATSPLCKVTAAIEAERKALTDGCAYCGADTKKTIDHVVPYKLGGLHVPSNIVGACHSCNSSKNASPVEEWYRKQPFFSEQRWQRIQEITGDGQLSLI